MSTASDPELLSFSTELIEKHGGLVEPEPHGLLAFLPQPLARTLDLPEEVYLGSGQTPLLYGSPVLDRLIEFATRDIPIVYAQIEVPYLKKAGFEQLLGRELTFSDGQVRLGGRAEARATYMVLVCPFVALSDERREGLVEVAIHEGSGALVSGFEELWEEHQPTFFSPGQVPPHFPVHLEQAVSAAMQGARALVEERLSDFLKSMQRRLQRDVRNTREYYEALSAEMEAALSQAGLTEEQRRERAAKSGDLPREMARKIDDLEQKHRVRVTVTAGAALRLLIDVVQLSLELRLRKQHRSIRAIWNPITRQLDPLVCEGCRATIRSVHPVVDGASIRLLCLACRQGEGPKQAAKS